MTNENTLTVIREMDDVYIVRINTIDGQTGEYAPNSTIEIDGVECKTDDNGKVYAKMEPDFHFILEPSCEYTINGYKYTTHDKGRM